MTTETTVGAIMTRAVQTVECNESLERVDDLMRKGRMRHVPVVADGGRLVGMISQRDISRATLANLMGIGEAGQTRLLRSLAAKEAMSSPVVTVSPDSSIRAAALLLVERRIGCLAVVGERGLVGLVSETDILRWASVRGDLGPLEAERAATLIC